jgi:hypothetical protein
VNKQTNSGSADEELKTRIDFHQQLTGWNWSAIVESHWDPDGFTNPTDRSRSYTDRLPEININFQPNAFPGRYRNWLGFQMANLALVGALYYIGPEKSEINGFYGRMETRFTRNDEIGKSHTMQSTINYWQAISSTGDARYVYSTDVNWNWNLSAKLKWNLTWNRTDEEGRIPLSGMDRPSSPNNRLNWRLNFQNGRLYTITLATNYILNEQYQGAPGEVLSIKRLQPIALSFNYTPNRKSTITFSTSYDFKTDKLAAIRSTFSLTDFRSYRLNSTINYQPPGSITQFSTRATFIIGDDWDFEMNTEFSPKAGENLIRDIQVTHRLDCSFLTFQWRSQNNEWFITWGVSGYPQARLGYSTTEEAFGPDFFNYFQGTGGGFTGGGLSLGGGYGGYGGYGYGTGGGSVYGSDYNY